MTSAAVCNTNEVICISERGFEEVLEAAGGMGESTVLFRLLTWLGS